MNFFLIFTFKKRKSIAEIYTELSEYVGRLRENKDDDFKKNMDLVNILPTFLLRPISRIIGKELKHIF